MSSHPARLRAVSLVLAGTLALTACATGASEGPSASAVPSTEVSDAPASSSLSFTFPGGDRPTVARQLTGLDGRYINPGAVIEHNGELHMFANVFTAWPGLVRVPHLVSTDGTTWTLAAPEPILTSDDVPFAEPGADVSTGFVTDDGTWVLVFQTVNRSTPWSLGRATAPGPEGPWTVEPEPILTGGAEGEWDAGGLAWPSVVRTADGYLMYYTALDRPGGTGVIGLASSTDGVDWTKHHEPVLVAERGWELGKLDRPRVTVTPDGLVMIYAGGDLNRRGVARSEDGTTWQRDGDLPAITADDFPVSGRTWDVALIYRAELLHYYMEIGTASASGGTEIYLAVASPP